MRKWGRYHVLGEVLADEHGGLVASSDFASSVARQIADEPLPEHGNTYTDTNSDTNRDASAKVANLSAASSDTAVAVPAWSRFAVAASVALAVVVGVQQYQLNISQGAPQGQLLAAANTAMPAVVVADSPQLADVQQATGEVASQLALADDLTPGLAPSQEQQAQSLRAQQRLHEYMLEHANHAARQNGQGITPFARVANFEVQGN